MNLNEMIIVKGEDKTCSIRDLWFSDDLKVIFITYLNGKTYPYKVIDVTILKNPTNISVEDKLVYKQNILKSDAVTVQFFCDYCRIICRNRRTEICSSKDIKIIDSALHDEKSKMCFEYLKEVAEVVGLLNDNNKNILAAQYEKINFIRNDCVLASFLAGKRNKTSKLKNTNTNIFYPFNFNLSQKRAVENALNTDISIIEGPPGTGKTQTILNIIANAVVRGESVAVVSNNNSATENIYTKLKKYGLEFIAAQLGSIENKNKFIETQTSLPDMIQWAEKPNESSMFELKKELDDKLELRNKISVLLSEEEALKKEKHYFDEYYNTLSINGPLPSFSKKLPANKILAFSEEYEYLVSKRLKIGFFKKIALKTTYKLKKIAFLRKYCGNISAYCQNLFYERRLKEIEKRRSAYEQELLNFDFENKIKQYAEMSMDLFKYKLYEKYKGRERRKYSWEDLRTEANSFLNEYPIILSTTYSICSSLSSDICYDYVIFDEASQIDVVTGAIALSCAKKAVIVGDLKQLPNIVSLEQKQLTDKIFLNYNLPNTYRYSNHSFLYAMTELFPDVPRIMLKEHYRCHPEIIGFCNQMFYNGELIIMTSPESYYKPMMVYRTAAGNMARKHINERQIEVIRDEVFVQQKLNPFDGSVGIITPYRSQAARLQEEFKDTNVKAATVDKFQGLETSVIILSTVDNKIGEFASNPNRLNVAVSRAVNQFIVVTDGNENDKSSPIHELVEYIKYHNYEIIDSKINSVFDYLYEMNSKARECILRKYGRVSEFDSENLVFSLIKDILQLNNFSRFNVVMHVPLNSLLGDLSILTPREKEFAQNNLTHVDFLIFSKITHQPILVIEVDGVGYHNSDKQKERDKLKDGILAKYNIPILRLSTVGSKEKEKICEKLSILTGIS